MRNVCLLALLLSGLILSAEVAVASAETVTWAMVLPCGIWESAQSVRQTSDGGYIVAGYTDSFGAGSYDIFIMKLDADGEITWQKAYGGSGSDSAYSAQQTSDGGYIVAGETHLLGYLDMGFFKMDEDGEIPGFPYMADSDLQVADASAGEITTHVTIIESALSISTISLAVTDTNAHPTYWPKEPPLPPELESPSDESTDEPATLTLRWSHSSDPEGGAVKYTVYLDTSSPPSEVAAGGQDIANNFLQVSGLLPDTTYYWMVVAVDDEGETAESDVWSFTTTRPEEGFLILSSGVKYQVNKAGGTAPSADFVVLLTDGGDDVLLEAPDGASLTVWDGLGNDRYEVKSMGTMELSYIDGPGNDAVELVDVAGDDSVTVDDAEGSGNDAYSLTFTGTGTDSLSINDGEGDDRYYVGFSGASGPSFSMEVVDGPGNDRYAVRGGKTLLAGLSVTFVGGEGNDRLTILNLKSTEEIGIEIQDGDGNDGYWVRNIVSLSGETAEISIVDGEGNDVYIYRQGKEASSDIVNIADGDGKNKYTVDTGRNDDSVTIEDGEGASVYNIRLGEGDDSVEITDSENKDIYRVNGGSGEDTITVDDDYEDDGDGWRIINVETET